MIDGNRNTHVLHPSNEAVRPSGAAPIALWIISLLAIPGALAFGLASWNELQIAAAVVGLLAVMAVFARPYIGLVLFVILLYLRPEETFPALAGMRLTFGV